MLTASPIAIQGKPTRARLTVSGVKPAAIRITIEASPVPIYAALLSYLHRPATGPSLPQG
jgi:hypothetical protein